MRVRLAIPLSQGWPERVSRCHHALKVSPSCLRLSPSGPEIVTIPRPIVTIRGIVSRSVSPFRAGVSPIAWLLDSPPPQFRLALNIPSCFCGAIFSKPPNETNRGPFSKNEPSEHHQRCYYLRQLPAFKTIAAFLLRQDSTIHPRGLQLISRLLLVPVLGT